MGLPWSRTDRENNCFVENSQNKVAKRVVGEIYNGADVVSLANPLPTTAVVTGDINVDSTSINVDAYIGKPSGTNADFTTARTGNTTFSCTSLPTGVSAIMTEDIEMIRQINGTGEVVATYSRDDAMITCVGTSTTIVMVTGATFGSADSIILYTNISKPKKVVGSEGVAVKTNATGEIITAVPTTLGSGSKVVTTAGTAVALASSTACKTVFIKANSANTGKIYVGGVTVDSSTGIPLDAEEHVELDIANLATVYIDSAEDGEGVGFTYSV
jgi:hypothetical protein